MNKTLGKYVVTVVTAFFLITMVFSFLAPHLVHAQLSKFLPGLPFGGKILTVIPNPPPPAPNPCYEPNSYIITIGFPRPMEVILKGITTRVINGTTPPFLGVWSLGLYSLDITGACPTPVIKIIGVGGIF